MANLDDATKITSGIALNTLVYETLEFVRQQLSAWRDDLDTAGRRVRRKAKQQLVRLPELPRAPQLPDGGLPPRRIPDGPPEDRPVGKNRACNHRRHSQIHEVRPLSGHRREASARTDQRPGDGIRHGPRRNERWPPALQAWASRRSLEIAAMVGYVQDNDLGSWLVRINGWITSLNGTDCSQGCHWSSTEQIGDYRLIKRARVASGKSRHPRSSPAGSEIQIHHFWVSMRRKRTRTKRQGNG